MYTHTPPTSTKLIIQLIYKHQEQSSSIELRCTLIYQFFLQALFKDFQSATYFFSTFRLLFYIRYVLCAFHIENNAKRYCHSTHVCFLEKSLHISQLIVSVRSGTISFNRCQKQFWRIYITAHKHYKT